jgi:hypothetical protein
LNIMQVGWIWFLRVELWLCNRKEEGTEFFSCATIEQNTSRASSLGGFQAFSGSVILLM